MREKVLIIIPARLGSKRLKQKNILLIKKYSYGYLRSQ